ncbi:hypothetical protein BC828DRAFT_377860 [Blastocladiella britannica]|nr:hypothetical protein BC828DRAFT_377860 [Blastocladiella britannica]
MSLVLNSKCKKQAFAALNPFRPIQKNLMDDTDLAGPLLFCLMFGIFLLMVFFLYLSCAAATLQTASSLTHNLLIEFQSKKLVFSYIYGLGALGCLGMYAILNLMSDRGIEGSQTVAVLGYCLLPMVLLSMVTAVLNVSTSFGLLLSGLSVCWCTYSASTMFVTVLSMSDQRLLVAYPVGLLYAIFALLTIF